jgi:hypothetical protein
MGLISADCSNKATITRWVLVVDRNVIVLMNVSYELLNYLTRLEKNAIYNKLRLLLETSVPSACLVSRVI